MCSTGTKVHKKVAIGRGDAATGSLWVSCVELALKCWGEEVRGQRLDSSEALNGGVEETRVSEIDETGWFWKWRDGVEFENVQD